MLDDPKVLAKRIKSAVTDAEREIRLDWEAKPGVSNLLSIFSALTGRAIPELEEAYAGKGYGDLKKDLAEVVVEFAKPFQERFATFAGDTAELDLLLAEGAARATELAQPTLARVYERVGLLPPMRISG